MNIEMRLAKAEEIKLCSGFIDEARIYQNEQGFVQWTKQYPNIDTITKDIQKGRGYILLDDNLPFGYLCVDFEGEPAYQKINGAWNSTQAYAVIHRMAFGVNGRGKGAAREVFQLVKKLCLTKDIHCIRVDTDEKNIGMQYILKQEGYCYCGTVIFENSPKLAFELIF